MNKEVANPTTSNVKPVTGQAYSRLEDLRDAFNSSVASALALPLDDYFQRLNLEGLLTMKRVTSPVHAIITLKLVLALAHWLGRKLELTAEQIRKFETAADESKPFGSGFDLDSQDPNVIAEVKGNIPIKGGASFGAAQLKGLTDDVRQMFGQPARGKTIETVSGKSKIRRDHLTQALKFLGVYDSPLVRQAVGSWMKSFRKSHPELNVSLAEDVKDFSADTVYVVFLTLNVGLKREEED